MTKLILTTGASGSGHLKQAGIADRVIWIDHRLVWGAVPRVADAADFLDARREKARAPGATWAFWAEWEDAPPDEPAEDTTEAAGDGIEALQHFSPRELWRDLVSTCAAFDHVELWIDPAPNAQLILLQLLDRASRHPEILAKLALVQADAGLGERAPGDPTTLEAVRRPVESRQLDLARRAWAAFAEPTPQAWLRLLDDDLSTLPYLRACVLEMLRELPDAVTGLGATETRMLELIAPGAVGPFDVFPGHLRRNTRSVFEYWEVGQLLHGLAVCATPAVVGLDEGPFTLAMHDDAARLRRYRACEVSLSAFGQRLIARRVDFAHDNIVDRWWGGTRLTNDNLWRWDEAGRRLIAPS